MPSTRSRGGRRRKATEQFVPKAALAREVARILEERQITQTEAAWIAKDAPSQISLVVTGKLRGFSVERLLRLVSRLGRDIDIVIRPTARGRVGKVRLTRR